MKGFHYSVCLHLKTCCLQQGLHTTHNLVMSLAQPSISKQMLI